MANPPAPQSPATCPPKAAGLSATLKLKATRTHWEKLARADARWAVLTDQEKKGGKWETEEFYATGRAEVAESLAWIKANGVAPPSGEALDFGCGVGRLSQALAEHFPKVTGVDVSAAMVSQAQTHNRHPDTVAYVHNAASDLSCFESGRFAFVYSLITLQHIPTELSRVYIAEFCRVVASGGLVLFQMTASRPKPRPFSFYPPTLLRRALEYIAVVPRIIVHALPRAEVEAILRASGVDIIAVRPHENGIVESYIYLAQKR